jgi:hypothetical protein
MTKQLTIKTCDVCGKQVTQDDTPVSQNQNNSELNQWIAVTRYGGAAFIKDIGWRRVFDVCSTKCLSRLGEIMGASDAEAKAVLTPNDAK